MRCHSLEHLQGSADSGLIEDCAEALGTRINGRHVGLDCDVATFSFYKNKTITTGEGGMIITKRNDWHDKLILLKGQGVPLTKRYWHEVLGYNYRLSNLSAALGTAQLAKLSSILIESATSCRSLQNGVRRFADTLQRELPTPKVRRGS